MTPAKTTTIGIKIGVIEFDAICAASRREKVSNAEIARRALRAYLHAQTARVEPFPPHLTMNPSGKRRPAEMPGAKLDKTARDARGAAIKG